MDPSSNLAAKYSLGVAVLFVLLSKILPGNVLFYYSYFSTALLSSIIIYYCYPTVKRWFWHERVTPHDKAVFITGCDAGIGHELAKMLEHEGYQVFAGCLLPDGDGASALREVCSSRLHVVEADVTKEDSVAQALSFVKENLGQRDFWALVNCAEAFEGFDVGWGKLEHFKRCISVNALGPVRMTRAFLPLLHRCKGRVVTLASICGRVSLPHLTPYTMSQYAAVAFSECLRLEVWRFGMKVISIEPELFKTPSNANLIEKFQQELAEADAKDKDIYGEKYFRNVKRELKHLFSYCSSNIRPVLESLEDAVTLEEPDEVYIPCTSFFRRFLAVAGQNLPIQFTTFMYDVFTGK